MTVGAGPAASVLALALGAAALNGGAARVFTPPTPDLSALRLSREDAVRSATLLSVGMRRLAADLAFIQLLTYYGTPEEEPRGHGHARHEEGPGAHAEPVGGTYPELLERSLRIVELDPYFSYVPVFSAGALVFNHRRPEEALELLRAASRRNPREWKFRAVVAGIGFHQKGKAEEVLRELSPILAEPDCPTLLKNMLAFLNRRLGRRDEAVRIYRDILLSKDASYHALARRALAELGAEPAGEGAP